MLRWIPLALAFAACAGCGAVASQSKSDTLTNTLAAYSGALRWGGFDQAIKYVDPETLKAHPLTSIDIERYKQVSIVSYTQVQPVVPVSKDEVSQVIEVGVVNNNTQVGRSVIDRQVWRYDETTKHWYVTSGLPDITQH